jgi:hypothetical protein
MASTGANLAARIRELATRLQHVAAEADQDRAVRNELEEVLAELRALVAQHFGPRRRARRGEGGKAKILNYLRERVGEEVHGEELAAVSGIQEWARRVRELRDSCA